MTFLALYTSNPPPVEVFDGNQKEGADDEEDDASWPATARRTRQGWQEGRGLARAGNNKEDLLRPATRRVCKASGNKEKMPGQVTRRSHARANDE